MVEFDTEKDRWRERERERIMPIIENLLNTSTCSTDAFSALLINYQFAKFCCKWLFGHLELFVDDKEICLQQSAIYLKPLNAMDSR